MPYAMETGNLQIDIENLPRSEDVTFQPLERDYLKPLRLSWVIASSAILILTSLFFLFMPKYRTLSYLVPACSGWLVLTAWMVINGIMGLRYRSYALRERDILYRTGWITRSLHVVPLSRVQHAVVHSGPLDRRFGLASLSVHTAASDIGDITIPGLRATTAEAMRAYIIEKIKDIRTDGGME